MSWATRQQLHVRTMNRVLGGVPVKWGAVQSEGMLRKGGELVINGQAEIVEIILDNLPTSLFGSLVHGDRLTADGDTYEVTYDPSPMGDGAFCRVILQGPIAAPPPIYGPRVLTTATGERLVTATGNPITTAQGFIHA